MQKHWLESKQAVCRRINPSSIRNAIHHIAGGSDNPDDHVPVLVTINLDVY